MLRLGKLKTKIETVQPGLFAYTESLKYPFQYLLVNVLLLDIGNGLVSSSQHHRSNLIAASLQFIDGFTDILNRLGDGLPVPDSKCNPALQALRKWQGR